MKDLTPKSQSLGKNNITVFMTFGVDLDFDNMAKIRYNLYDKY